MRSKAHITETRSVKKVLNILPDHWVVRELSERDYGIDLVLEIFTHTHESSYESTGAICNIQLKGTEKSIRAKGNTVSFSIKKSFLEYVERFAVPFFLFYVDVTSKEAPVYFVWLQRYIQDVLDEEPMDWRTDKKKSLTLKIPKENVLKSRLEKIEKIAIRLPYIEQLVRYAEIYEEIEPKMEAMAKGGHETTPSAIDYLIKQIRKIFTLKLLLEENDSCVSEDTIYSVLEIIKECERKQDFSALEEEKPEFINLKHLADSLLSFHFNEDFLAEYDAETVY